MARLNLALVARDLLKPVVKKRRDDSVEIRTRLGKKRRELIMVGVEHEGSLFRCEEKIHRVTEGGHQEAFRLVTACGPHSRARFADLCQGILRKKAHKVIGEYDRLSDSKGTASRGRRGGNNSSNKTA